MRNSSHYTAAMAADPTLPVADMQIIASERPDLIPALASNPALYPALREWLEQHPDPAIPAVVAAQEQVSEVQEVPEVVRKPLPALRFPGAGSGTGDNTGSNIFSSSSFSFCPC